jgi:hypothetical protein
MVATEESVVRKTLLWISGARSSAFNFHRLVDSTRLGFSGTTRPVVMGDVAIIMDQL